jgi:cell division protein FtsB
MADEQTQSQKRAAAVASVPLSTRIANWTMRGWRPAGTAVAVILALLLTWHEKRAEDQQLRRDIQDLRQENARLKDRIEKLKSDPDAIEHEAREKLHYAKPGEVIYALPAESK